MGQDYDETYSRVAKCASVRTLFALAAVRGLFMRLMDVNNAFLQSDLREEIYIRLPEGLGGAPQKVLRLKKPLLKQAPRTWEKELGGFLESRGFKRTLNDNAFFVRVNPDGSLVFSPIYVDNLQLVASTSRAMEEIEAELAKGYEVKVLGEVSHYLRVHVTNNKEGKTLSLGLPQYITVLEGKLGGFLKECGAP